MTTQFPGSRRLPSAKQAEPSILQALAALPVALLSDNMARLPGTIGLQPYHRVTAQLVGTAVTVRTRSGDNLVIHRAFDYCRPGDVLVIDGGGDVSQALVGEIMATYAESIGVAGLAIDGAIRDVRAFRERSFPCYARGVTHKGPYKGGPGDINVPVAIGGLVIAPGDIVVGDDDGLIAIPQAIAAEVIAKARKQEQAERETLAAIREKRYDRSWLDALEKKLAS